MPTEDESAVFLPSSLTSNNQYNSIIIGHLPSLIEGSVTLANTRPVAMSLNAQC